MVPRARNSKVKVLITGHTSGIGKFLLEHYTNNGHTVIGMSRSNGYDILKDQDKIIDEAKDVDLFINNATSGTGQLDLLKKLCFKIPNIVTMSTMGTEFTNVWANQYHYDKIDLENAFKLMTMNPNVGNLLLLKISFAETTYSDFKEDRINSDSVIPYQQLANSIDFWLDNPKVTQINYAVKLTEYTIDQAKKLTNNPELVDNIVKQTKEVCKL